MASIDFLAIAIGLIAAIRAAILVISGQTQPSNVMWQRFAFVVAALCALTASRLVPAVQGAFGLTVEVMAVAQLLLAGAALIVFRTRWRPMIESFAAISLSILSFLTGFSIGIFLTPFALALSVVSLVHSSPAPSRLRALRPPA